MHKGGAKKVLAETKPTDTLKAVYIGKIVCLRDTAGNATAYIGQIKDIVGYDTETAILRCLVDIPGIGQMTTSISAEDIDSNNTAYRQRKEAKRYGE